MAREALDPEDVVVEGRVGAELRLLEAEGLAPGRLLRRCFLVWGASGGPSLSPRRRVTAWVRHRRDAKKIRRTPVKNLDRRPEVEVRFGRGIKKPLELEAALGHEDLAR